MVNLIKQRTRSKVKEYKSTKKKNIKGTRKKLDKGQRLIDEYYYNQVIVGSSEENTLDKEVNETDDTDHS